jgi:hypothetical protein
MSMDPAVSQSADGVTLYLELPSELITLPTEQLLT